MSLGVPQARTTIWLYRLPSLFGAIVAVLLTYWAALAFVSRRGALLAALMMASSVRFGVEARLAKTDAMLLLTSVAAMGAMARIYLACRRTLETPVAWKHPAILWTALAAGTLLKGPRVRVFVGRAAVARSVADRSARWVWALRPVAGFAWLVLLVLPWFLAIVAKSGSDFFVQAVGHDMLGKVTSGQEAHGAPPGLYFILFWITFWPGSVLAGLAAPASLGSRGETRAEFLLAWLVPSWIVFEAVMTKLPHYVLPLYPAIAILIAGALERRVLSRSPWLKRGAAWWFVVPAGAAVIAVIGAIKLTHYPAFPAWPFLAAATVFGLFCSWIFEGR